MANVLQADFQKCLDHFAGASPFGVDARYDSTFMDLKAEILKLTAMSSKEGRIDWKSVKAWSVEILTATSKDLTVAGYLTMALLLTDGYAGLLDGLEIIHTFVRDDWDGIYPPAARIKARILGLEWLVTRLSPLIEDRAPTIEEAPLLARLRELAQAIGDVARERCGADAPSFSGLVGAFSARMAETTAPPPAAVDDAAVMPAAISTQPAAAPPAPTPGGSPQAAVAPPGAAPAVPRAREAAAAASAGEVKEQVRVLAAVLRQIEPVSPLPFRLLRALKWDELTGPPPADPATGRTRVPPPRPQQRTALDGLFQAEQWTELLHASEGAFGEPSGTFWLDLQRYTVIALETLDVSGQGRAAAAVKTEVGALLSRFSNLAGLQFSDGTPFATEATKTWLEEITQTAGKMLALPVASAGRGGESPVLSEADAAEVRKLFAAKKLPAALDILQRGIERAPTARATFHTRLAAARLCLEAEQTPWARTLLEELLRDMEAFTFEHWEPETAVEVLQLLAVGYARLAKDKKTENREGLRDELETIKGRLFRLDMRAAAAVDELLRR